MKVGTYRSMFERMQRRIALRVGSAYKTVSLRAIQMVTGVVPIHILVSETKRMSERPDRLEESAKSKNGRKA